MADLRINLCGLELAHPVMPAAGPPVRDGASGRAAVAGGASGIVAKTVSLAPAMVPRPCMVEIRGGFLNTELWSELPKEQWLAREYQQLKDTGVPVIISIGYAPDEVGLMARLVSPFADALELSTHYVGSDISPILKALELAKKEVDVPVLVKLSPHPNIQEIALGVEAGGADGLVMINSFGPCLSIDVETGMPQMGSPTGYGWLSGPALKPLALRCVFEAAQAVKIPIIGVGGVSCGRDVAEMFMAGAAAVQVCTQAILEGPQIYNKLVTELDEFLDSHGYASVAEIKGLTIKKMAGRVWNCEALAPEVDHRRCKLCGSCKTSCRYQAITMSDRLTIDTAKCFGCGLCVSRCRHKALRMPDRSRGEQICQPG